MSVVMPSKTVLIVEDHPDMRELLVWQIELMGYTPLPASTAKEALEKAIQLAKENSEKEPNNKHLQAQLKRFEEMKAP